MKISIPLSILGCLLIAIQASGQININEYSASNLNQFLDNHDTFEDWIEIHNSSDEAVDIAGWHLSDKESKPQKWTFPPNSIIPSKGFLRLWCSGRNDSVFYSNMHTNFKLTQTKSDEVLVLSQANGNIVESVPLELTLLGHSRCREMDALEGWKICEFPTPRASNNFSTKRESYTPAPVMSLNAGYYSSGQSVEIFTSISDATIRYTTNGTNPIASSPVYTTPIEINATMVLKARVFSSNPDILPGKILFNTYFINEDFSLPVISVAANQLLQLAGGNRDLRPIGSIEWFNVDKQRSATSFGDLNSHGQDSWVLDQRSIDWVSRDEMGYSKAINEKLFSYSDREEYQRIILRASGDDNYPAINDGAHEFSTHVRDEYVHTLAQEGGMKLDVRAVERVIVFLNGQYWGVYGLRERPVDHDYIKEYYDQDKYHVQFLSTWGFTQAEYGGQQAFDDWADIRDFILNNDMGDPANYQIAKDNIQLTGLIDYMIANLNSVASDWLNYNTGWWRGIDPKGDHKKWGYILWDNDATFDYYINYSGVPDISPNAKPCDIDEISDFMDNFFNGSDVGLHEKIFLKLQAESEEFRQLYYSRQADLMNTVYTCENMLTTLDRMVAKIAPEMPRQIQRWGGTMQEWEQNVVRLRSFIEQRCGLLDDGMVDCFEVTGPYELTLMTAPEGVGKIDLNTIKIEALPWTGNYFGGMENLVKAKATEADYEFIRWESKAGSVLNKTYDRRSGITLTGPDTLIAHFGILTNTFEIEPGVSFQLYPTIVEDQLTLKYELEKGDDIAVSLHSVLGNKVIEFPEISGATAAGRYNRQLDIGSRDLPAGLYFLNFRIREKVKAVKIQVIR